jgi:hypothetical protein
MDDENLQSENFVALPLTSRLRAGIIETHKQLTFSGFKTMTNINPTEHISEKLENDSVARDEFNAVLDSDHFRDYTAEDVPVEFDDDDGFDLTGDEDFDPSGGFTEDDFPVEFGGDDPENDYDDYGFGALEAEAEAYHSQWD